MMWLILALSVPVSLFSGGRDILSTTEDLNRLRGELEHTIVYDEYIDKFDHLDFVMSIEAKDTVYSKIIEQIREKEARWETKSAGEVTSSAIQWSKNSVK